MIFVTGDTHAEFSRFSSDNFPDGKTLTKNDYVIITGDFGGIWDVNESQEKESYWLNWLNDKPWTTLFVDGNHENFDRLNVMPEDERFGATVGVVKDSILHLKRGYVYVIDGKKIFTFGGGYSIDKARRSPHTSWWDQELPSFNEYSRGLKNLELVDNSVDFMITHTCSHFDFNHMSNHFDMNHKIDEHESQLRKYFNILQYSIKHLRWFCGHFHVDEFQAGKTEFLFESIKKIN